jgi:uncharacterized surface protein with fasciclin (FAS1) repeats
VKRFVLPLIAMLAIAATVVPSVAAASSSKNLVQVAASNPQFSTLVTLVKKAGLVSALSGKSKLTVLAPTNAAFSKVPKKTLNALLKNKKQLRAVLLYHVLKGAVPARTVVKLHSAKTLEGSSIKIRVRGGKVYVNNARVIKTDVKASNGIIHVINSVLIPPK